MRSLRTPDQFKTPLALFAVGAIGLVLAYLLGTRAIDTGSLGQYFATFLLLIVSIRLILRGLKSKK